MKKILLLSLYSFFTFSIAFGQFASDDLEFTLKEIVKESSNSNYGNKYVINPINEKELDEPGVCFDGYQLHITTANPLPPYKPRVNLLKNGFIDNTIYSNYLNDYFYITVLLGGPTVYDTLSLISSEMLGFYIDPSNNNVEYVFEFGDERTSPTLYNFGAGADNVCQDYSCALSYELGSYVAASIPTVVIPLVTTNCYSAPPSSPPLSESCYLSDFIKGEKKNNDIEVFTDGVTNYEFEQYINTYGITNIDATFIAPGQTSFTTNVFNGQFFIESWLEVLQGWGSVNEVAVQLTVSNANETYTCPSVFITIMENGPICEIFSLLKYKSTDGVTVTFDFSDPNDPTYFVNALQSIGLTLAQAQQLFDTNIDHVQAILNYDNSSSTGNTGTGGMNRALGDPISNFALTINSIDTSGMIGILDLQYNLSDGIPKNCTYSPVEFGDTPPPQDELPNLDCNSTHSYPDLSNSTPLGVLRVGDVLNSGGFYFLVTEVVSSSAPFAGKAKTALPFGNKRLQVEFSGISINEDLVVTQGEIVGVEGNPSDYPFFLINPDTINFGGEICIEDPVEAIDSSGIDPLTGLDDRDFDKDGNHKNGTKYDDKGFDVNGKYQGEGDYDPNGCNYEGLDSLGQPCIQTNEDTEFIKTYTDSIANQFPGLTDSLINDAIAKLTLELSNLNCDSKRDSMDNLLNGSLSHLDQSYIVGERREYIDDGLSENFSSEPKIPILNSNIRDENIVLLEKLHVALYTCDHRKGEIDKVMEDLNNSLSNQIVTDLLKRELGKLTKYQVTEFMKDQNLLFEHILSLLNDIASGKITTLYKKNKYDYWNQGVDYYNSLSSLDNMTALESNKLKEIDWMYNQGFKTIGGQHRGFYVEELYRQMKREAIMMIDGEEELGKKLPLSLERTINSKIYRIFLTNLAFSTTGATLDAYFIFEDPNSGKRIVISGENLQFNSGGMVGTSSLVLQTNVELRLNNASMLGLHAGETRVSWDCDGFQSIDIGGHVEFCENFIMPVDPSTMAIIPDERYKLDFSINLTDWTQFYIEFNNGGSKPFVMTKHQDMVWDVSNFAIDISDVRSPTAALEYKYETIHSDTGGSSSTLKTSWKGVYIGALRVNLPKKFSSDPNNQKYIQVSSMVIDGNGVSTHVSAGNILSINEGSASGWPISIEGLEIFVVKNRITGGGFNGEIRMPVFEEPMNYTATYQAGNIYTLTVEPFSTPRTMPMMLADVTLDPTSNLKMQYADGDFTIVATLNGKLEIGISQPMELNLPDIKFRNFKVGNKSPYFEAGEWEVSNNVSFSIAGFKMSISGIKPVSYEDDGETLVGVAFKTKITLAKDKITAEGGFEILGHNVPDQYDRQDWKFKKVKMNSLYVDAKFEAGSIYGYIERFENDPDYGEGFVGMIKADFTSMPIITAKALFGRDTNSDFKYFFVDALISDLPAPLTVGFLEINGFVGGLSYHMRQEAPGSIINPCTKGLPSDAGIGESLSGTTYVPDINIGLGFKVGACIATAKSEEIFNGLISIEMAFNTSENGGGINSITFNGIGNFMTAADKMGEFAGVGPVSSSSIKPTQQPLCAHIRISYFFNKKELHGTLVAYLNVNNKLRGSAGSNKLVDAELHADANKWYIYIGTPTMPCGIELVLPIATVKLTAYIDIGTDVPNIPDLDERIRAIAYKAAKNPNFRNSGAGFAFGAKAVMTMNMDVVIAQANLTAILGFDVMVKNFGDARCVGADNTVGVNGWYAVGQLYAFLEGSISVWGVNVMSAGIAAVLQAQLPNPFFAQATVGVRARILGITRKSSFRIKLGNQCQIETNDPVGLEIIDNINPANNGKDISTESNIDVFFNAPVNSGPIAMQTLNGTKEYDITIKSATITSKSGYPIPFDYVWDEEHYKLTLDTWDLFYTNDSIVAKVVIEIKEGNNIYLQEKEIEFVTGKGVSYIPEDNVEYAYPSKDMKNFYKDEYNQYKGVVKLKQFMPELIYSDLNEYELKVKIDNGTTTYIRDVVLDWRDRSFKFDIDPAIFLNGVTHEISIMKMKSGQYSAESPSGSGNTSSAMSSNSAVPGLGGPIHRTLYKYKFRVSKYNTFIDKLKNSFAYNKVENANRSLVFSAIDEPFDNIELESITKGLVSSKISINDSWNKTYVDDLRNLPLPYEAFIGSVPFTIDLDYLFRPLDQDMFEGALRYDDSRSNYNIGNVGSKKINFASNSVDQSNKIVFYGPDLACKALKYIQSRIDAAIAQQQSNNPESPVIPGQIKRIYELKPSNVKFNKPDSGPLGPTDQYIYHVDFTYTIPGNIMTSNYRYIINTAIE